MATEQMKGGEMQIVSELRKVEASEAGALDGYEAKCSCGLVIRSSLESLARADVASHQAWHAKNESR